MSLFLSFSLPLSLTDFFLSISLSFSRIPLRSVILYLFSFSSPVHFSSSSFFFFISFQAMKGDKEGNIKPFLISTGIKEHLTTLRPMEIIFAPYKRSESHEEHLFYSRFFIVFLFGRGVHCRREIVLSLFDGSC